MDQEDFVQKMTPLFEKRATWPSRAAEKDAAKMVRQSFLMLSRGVSNFFNAVKFYGDAAAKEGPPEF